MMVMKAGKLVSYQEYFALSKRCGGAPQGARPSAAAAILLNGIL
jgi:hypothetical protein